MVADSKYSLCFIFQKCDLLQQFGKRNVQVCNECCHSPGCNRHLCIAGKKHIYSASMHYQIINQTLFCIKCIK